MPEEHEITEENVKQFLTGWLTPYVHDIWWEQKNDFGCGVFSVKGTGGKKPDMIIRYRREVVAVEVKMGLKSKELYNAFPQILDYYNDVTECYIDGQPLKITGYVVATKNSIDGRLFREECFSRYESMDKSRREIADQGRLPHNEYERTEMFTRILWRMTSWREGVFIGALLSSALDDENTRYPKILGKEGKQQFFTEVEDEPDRSRRI